MSDDVEGGQHRPRRGSRGTSGALGIGAHAHPPSSSRRRPAGIDTPSDGGYGATMFHHDDEEASQEQQPRSGSTLASSPPSRSFSIPRTPSAVSIGRRGLLTRTMTLVGESTPFNKMTRYFVLPPEDSVYSYFLYMPPIEQRREKRYITPLIIFALTLVFVNFVMQGGLLYVVGLHIMHKHVEWVSTLVHLKQEAWYHIFPMPYNIAPSTCYGKDSSLCTEHGMGMLSCAPKSIQFLSDWHLLDTDGDDLWSKSEAHNKTLGDVARCEYNVDLPLMYDSLVHQLRSSEHLKDRLDDNLISGEAVHKAYFNWFLHKPMLCMYGDADICGQLFQRGFFDEALGQKSLPMFTDVASALKYCNRILNEECFDILPSTYRVWRLVSNQQCGAKLYGQSDFHIGDNGDDASRTPVVTVDFEWLKEYASTKDFKFRLFLGILLTTFLSVMALEARSIFKVFIWTATFPKDTEAGSNGEIVSKESVDIVTDWESQDLMKEEPELAVKRQAINKVRDDHRYCVLAMTILRLILWVCLLYSGIMFLTTRPRYLTLIFDALSLVFIFEIDELLYRTMLRVEFRNDHLNTDDLIVPQLHGGSVHGRFSVMADIVLFVFIILFAAAVVYTYCSTELDPLIDSLECLCTVSGERCYESRSYPKDWWDTYWSTTLPAANMIIRQLNSSSLLS